MQTTFDVRAVWNPEIRKWCSETDIRDLFIEAFDLVQFEDVMRHFGPELIHENHYQRDNSDGLDLSNVMTTIVWERPDERKQAA